MAKALNKQAWNSLAHEWAVQTPPWRPTVKEINIYEEKIQRAIKGRKNPKVLILGATPELRDVCAKLKIDAYLADVNINMVRGMAELLEISDGNEPVEICNWLEMPYKDNSFDVVMCDHGIQHIEEKNWGSFFSEVRRVLKINGYFINSVFCLNDAETIDEERVVSIFRNTLFSREYKYYYMNRLIFSLPDYKGSKHLKYCEEVNINLRKLLKNKKISREEYKFLKVPYPINTCKVNIQTKEAMDAATHRYFTIKSVTTNIEHPDFTAHKIYYLKKPKSAKNDGFDF